MEITEKRSLIGRLIEEPRQLIALAILNYLVGATAYTFAEGVNWFDASWFYSVTGSTTGYGDIFPKTAVGRCIAVEVMFSNWLVFSLLLVHFLNNNLKDQHKFTHTEQELIKGLLGELVVQARLLYQLITEDHRSKMEALHRIEARQIKQDAFNRELASRIGIDYDSVTGQPSRA